MTSEQIVQFVWAWLPGRTSPVACGTVWQEGSAHRFRYGRSYRENPDAIALFGMPLGDQPLDPPAGMTLHGALRDALPDAWGQHIILARLTGRSGQGGDTGDLTAITYMRNSSSDRFGAIDFQDTADAYVARYKPATLDDLAGAALALEQGRPLPSSLDAALTHGTSVGGARPKATLTDRTGSWIAKFSSSSDRGNPVVRHEALALRLATLAGVDTVEAHLTTAAGRDALLVRRFDRTVDGARLMAVSGLTLLQLDEMAGRYATYPDLLDVLRDAGQYPERVGEELFTRIAANIALGNTDDHARNHAALWDGQRLSLTPAYDIDPCRTPGWDANQAMVYGRNGERTSSLAGLINVSATYDLDRREASDIVDRVITAIEDNWDDAVDEVGLTKRQAESIYGSRILNESTTDDLPTVTRAGWAGDRPIMVETDPPPSGGPVWVHPHRRGGHPVAGHWRKTR
jgi:serine/threonine-protein kinase HipA